MIRAMSTPTSTYTLRRGTVADIPTLVEFRLAMFQEIGTPGNYELMAPAYETWLQREMPPETYRTWVIEDVSGRLVAVAGLVLHVRAPGPRGIEPYQGYVSSVYVLPEHRLRGLARRLMEVIHDVCRTEGVRIVNLHASDAGRALYASMGYVATDEMRLVLEPVQ